MHRKNKLKEIQESTSEINLDDLIDALHDS